MNFGISWKYLMCIYANSPFIHFTISKRKFRLQSIAWQINTAEIRDGMTTLKTLLNKCRLKHSNDTKPQQYFA